MRSLCTRLRRHLRAAESVDEGSGAWRPFGRVQPRVFWSQSAWHNARSERAAGGQGFNLTQFDWVACAVNASSCRAAPRQTTTLMRGVYFFAKVSIDLFASLVAKSSKDSRLKDCADTSATRCSVSVTPVPQPHSRIAVAAVKEWATSTFNKIREAEELRCCRIFRQPHPERSRRHRCNIPPPRALRPGCAS